MDEQHVVKPESQDNQPNADTTETQQGMPLSRRRFLGTLAGGAAGLLVGGIGSKAVASSSKYHTFGILRQEAVTIEFWFGEPPENGPQAMADAFMAANPDIKVVATRYVNDDTGNTKLDAALQGGAGVDVFMTYSVPRLAARIAAGVAEDMTPLIAEDSDLKNWTDTTAGLFKVGDQFFCLPTVREPHAIILNKNMLDAAGIAVPQQWTVEEFRMMAKELTKVDNGLYGSWSPPDTPRVKLGSNAFYKEGAKESNFDDPSFREWLELWVAMVKENSAFPWTEVLAQNLGVYQQGVFLTEQMAVWPTSQFVLRYINNLEEFPHEFVTTFAPYPTVPGVDNPFNPGGINNYVSLNSKTPHKEAAWKFVQFRIKEGAQYMLKSSKAPAFPGTSAETIVDSILGPNKDTLYDVEAYRRVMVEPNYNLVSDTVIVGLSQIQQIFNQQRDRVLIGEISPEEWVTTVKQQSDDAIKSAGG